MRDYVFIWMTEENQNMAYLSRTASDLAGAREKFHDEHPGQQYITVISGEDIEVEEFTV